MAPHRSASCRAKGVNRYVAAAATKRQSRDSRTDRQSAGYAGNAATSSKTSARTAFASVSSVARTARPIRDATVFISPVPIPCVVTHGVPTRDTAGDGRRLRVIRDGVLVQGDPAASLRSSAWVPVIPRPCRSMRAPVGVGPLRQARMPLVGQAGGQRLGIRDHVGGVPAGTRASPLPLSATAFGRDPVHERAALHHREDRLVDGPGVLLAAQDHAAAGPRRTLWVVKVTTSA